MPLLLHLLDSVITNIYICLLTWHLPWETQKTIPDFSHDSLSLGWDFVLELSSRVQWAKEVRRTGSHVISCCTWKLTRKKNIFFHLFDLLILNIYLLLTLKTRTWHTEFIMPNDKHAGSHCKAVSFTRSVGQWKLPQERGGNKHWPILVKWMWCHIFSSRD